MSQNNVFLEHFFLGDKCDENWHSTQNFHVLQFSRFFWVFFFLTQNVMQKFHCVNVLRTHINYWWQKSENLYLLWHNRDLRKSGVKISYDLSSRFVPFQSAFLDMDLKRSLATALWPDAFELQLGFWDKSQCTKNALKSRIFD